MDVEVIKEWWWWGRGGRGIIVRYDIPYLCTDF